MTHQQLWFRHETLLRRAVVAAGADPGIWVVSAWSFHTIRFWPTGYTSSSVPRISLRIHHKHSVYHPPHCARLFCTLALLAAVINALSPVESRAAVRIAVGLLRGRRTRQVVADSVE